MFWKQADYWDYIRKDYKTLSEPYSEGDFKDVFKFLRKFCIMQCLFKKYVKVDSTYINGLFKGFDRVVHDTPKLVPDVRDETRNDNVVKMFPRYLVCEKDTKRWSSGYHTIISHSDIKRIVTAPPGYLLTYFDIKLDSVA